MPAVGLYHLYVLSVLRLFPTSLVVVERCFSSLLCSKWGVTGETNLVLSHSSSSTYCAWSVPRQNAVPMTMRYRDCCRRPWTGISGRNASDQAAGRMAQWQRNWSLKRRRLVMWLSSLQSPLTLQKVTVTVTLSDWIVYRPNVILTLMFIHIHWQPSGKLVLCCIFHNKLYSNIVWQFSWTLNLDYRYFGILSV